MLLDENVDMSNTVKSVERKNTLATGNISKTTDILETKKILATEDTSQTQHTLKTDDVVETGDTNGTRKSTVLNEGEKSSEVVGEDQEPGIQKLCNRKEAITDKGTKNETKVPSDDENKSILSRLFIHSQWLAVQSSYFKAMFYSDMKESYSEEAVMKIYEHELEAHQTLIQAMYRLDVLKEKNHRLVVQVLVLADKYLARFVIRKCKYVLLSTTPSLEMCEYILKETKHLFNLADIHDMLETFLVKEFTPFHVTWTLEKFTNLSEAALKLLLRSDNLDIQSENTIFVALMKWVRTNISNLSALKKCDLLDLVKFEFMSQNFLYDVVQNDEVAQQMLGFNKYLLKGLAYHGFSQIRREQLQPKPKQRLRLAVKAGDPTFSWVIDEKMKEKLSTSPGDPISSDTFHCQGYPMQLQLSYLNDSSNCRIYLHVLNLRGEACLCVSFTAKSSLFSSGTVEVEKALITAKNPSWGMRTIRNNTQKGHKIEVSVDVN